MPKTKHTFSWQALPETLKEGVCRSKVLKYRPVSEGYCDNNLWYVVSTLRWVG